MYKHAPILADLAILAILSISPVMPSIEEIVYDCLKSNCRDELFENVKILRDKNPYMDISQIYVQSYNKIKNG